MLWFCILSSQCLIVGGIFGILRPTLPLSFSEKGKLGKSNKENGHLNGFEYMQFEYMLFEYMYLSDLKIPYFCTRPPYPCKLFPWAQHSSPSWQDLICHRWTNRNWTQKDSTYNSLECEVEKKGSEVKNENLNTIHAKNCLLRGMWNGWTIRQNSAYFDALSNPFTH